jgi:hypothetical protein
MENKKMETSEDLAKAERLLHESVQELQKKHPPLTGTLTYTDEDAREANEHGF